MAATPNLNSVTDFSGFAELRASARAQSPEALKQAAKQFEAMFTQQLLKASHSEDRDSGSGGDLLGGSDSNVYRDLYDQQMAMHLASGRGLGIADMLVRQLQGKPAAVAGVQGGVQGLPLAHPAMPLPLPARPAQTSATSAAAIPKSADEFVDAIQPHAERAAKALGIPAQVLVAQAALETGWGKHQIRNADGSASHNFFGIKADAAWKGAHASTSTQEYADGKAHTEQAKFRSYGSIGEAFDDYVNFIKSNPRYANALRHGGDAGHYVHGLQKAGYATDPAYAQKIARIAYGRTMQVAMAAPIHGGTRIA